MPNLGLSELLVILLILMLVFGASRLPQLGESMGRTIRNFKRGVASDEKIEISKPSSETGSSSPNDKVSDAEVVDRKS